MASSKTIVLFGLLFAIVLLISSEVSARELAQETQSQDSTEGANCDHGYGRGCHGGHHHGGHHHGKPGHGGHHHGGHHGKPGHGCHHGKPGHHGHHGKPGHGCYPPEETEDVKN